MARQRTVEKNFQITDLGVHSGDKVVLDFYPAPVNTGIIFRRSDLADKPEVPARSEYVRDTRLGTTLVNEQGVRVATVEHLMAALAGLGIDNAYIDVSAQEIPIMDGSSAPFLELIKAAGIKEQEAPKKFIKIKHRIAVEDGDKSVSLEPYAGFKVSVGIEYNHPAFPADKQQVTVDFSSASFASEISQARTFGFLADYDMLKALNLAKGTSLENTIVLDDSKVLNEGGLRYEDEFVRHKILDAIGDLYLLGASILGEFKGYKSGHTMNHALRQELLASPDAWEYVSFDEHAQEVAPICFGQSTAA